MQKKPSKPKGKGADPTKQLSDFIVHTKRVLRSRMIVSAVQPKMVQSARAHIFKAYKANNLQAAEQLYLQYARELDGEVSQGALSAAEAKPVRENLDSFMAALRKKAKK